MKRILILSCIFILCLGCLCSCDLLFKKPCEHSEVVDAAVSPTCTEAGLTEGKHCSSCGEITVAQQSIAPLGHTELIVEEKKATCTEDGHTAGVICAVCNAELVAKKVILASHTYGEWEKISESDCFFMGERQRVCSACDFVDTEKLELVEHSFVQNSESGLFHCEHCDATIFAGHLYAAFDVKVNWYEAYIDCTELGGYLVTITSQHEQDFINNVAAKCAFVPDDWYAYYGYYYWTGAIYNNNWEWITGEEFEYTNWSASDPDYYTAQWHIVLSVGCDDNRGPANEIGDWEDAEHTRNHGFICEFDLNIVETEHYFTEWETVTEVSCFNDGEEYRLCTHCGLEETRVVDKLEHNFAFNEASGITSCEHCEAALYDGRIYTIIDLKLSWFDAYEYCANLGGHLVTITSEDEQMFVETYMSSQSFGESAWIGAYSDGVKWNWVSAEEFEYTNWIPGEPNCQYNKEFAVHVYQGDSGNYQWNDLDPLINKLYFICEWEVN